MRFRTRFWRLLGLAMFVVGIACLAWAIGWGHASAWHTAAMCFCASSVCLISRRRKPPEEG